MSIPPRSILFKWNCDYKTVFKRTMDINLRTKIYCHDQNCYVAAVVPNPLCWGVNLRYVLVVSTVILNYNHVQNQVLSIICTLSG